MDKKRVFLIRNVASGNFGGGEIYQLKLANALRRHGYEPVIVTNSRELLRNAKKDGFRTLIPPYSKRQNWSGWRNVLLLVYWVYQKRLAEWYREKIKEYRPAVINIQSRDDMIAGTEAAKKMGVRILWTDHADFRNWVLWNVNVKYKNAIGKKIVKLSRDVSKVIFVSKRVAEETEKMIKPLTLCNTVVVENGVEDKKTKYDGVKAKKGSFVFVGRVAEEKGIREMVEAFRWVVEEYSGVELNIYGDGEIEKYQKMCEKCNGVVFYGRTDGPLRVLAENEIFVLPSYREGLSLSLLDAAMMKKKIIASDVDGNPEVVVNGETGLLVPAKNAKKLAEAMIWMIKHKKGSEEMAENVRKKYEKEFDFEKIFEEKMLALYNGKKEEKK